MNLLQRSAAMARTLMCRWLPWHRLTPVTSWSQDVYAHCSCGRGYVVDECGHATLLPPSDTVAS